MIGSIKNGMGEWKDVQGGLWEGRRGDEIWRYVVEGMLWIFNPA